MGPVGVQLGGLIAGVITAGLAIAAQKVVTSFAGYFMIMRSRTFKVGDRIKMGGAHGDVIALGCLQTHILEMISPRKCTSRKALECGCGLGSSVAAF